LNAWSCVGTAAAGCARDRGRHAVSDTREGRRYRRRDRRSDRSGEITGKYMRAHLARHGIDTEIKHIKAGGADAQNAIQSYTADIGADFMVMGGYHHSRLREFILAASRAHPQVDDRAVFMSR